MTSRKVFLFSRYILASVSFLDDKQDDRITYWIVLFYIVLYCKSSIIVHPSLDVGQRISRGLLNDISPFPVGFQVRICRCTLSPLLIVQGNYTEAVLCLRQQKSSPLWQHLLEGEKLWHKLYFFHTEDVSCCETYIGREYVLNSSHS